MRILAVAFYCNIKSTFIILVIKSKTLLFVWNIFTISVEHKLKCYHRDTKCKNHLKKVFKKYTVDTVGR